MNGFDIQFAHILYIAQTFWSNINGKINGGIINVEQRYFQVLRAPYQIGCFSNLYILSSCVGVGYPYIILNLCECLCHSKGEVPIKLNKF